MRRALLRAVAALSLCLGSIEAAADQRPITVPGGDLSEVLTRLALDNGIDLLFASDLVRGRRSAGAREAQNVTEALRQILAGTGLDYASRGERAITIVPSVVVPSPSQHAEIRPLTLPEVTVRDRRLMSDPLAPILPPPDELAEHTLVSAAALARHPDGTVADALARMAGISVTLSSVDPNLGGLDTVARGEGQFVTVRGLDSEYDVTLINGANVAQGMPYSRQVELGLMPPFGLDRVDIVKVSGADRDGDAVGGTIDFRTPTAGDDPYTKLTVRGQLDQRAMQYGLDAGGGAWQIETARRFGANENIGVYFSAYYDRHDFVSSEQDTQSGQWGYRLTTTPGLGANPAGIKPEDNLIALSVNPQFTKGDIQRYGGSISLDWRGEDSTAYLRSTYGHDDTDQDVFQRGFQGLQYVTGVRQANGLYLTSTTDAQEHYWFETNPEQADLTTTILGGQSNFDRFVLSYDLFYSWGQNSRPDHQESSWGIQDPVGTYVGGLGGPLTLSYSGSPAYPVPNLTAAQVAALGDLSRFTAHILGELNVMESDQHKAGGQMDGRFDLSPGGEDYLKAGIKFTASRRFTDDRDYTVPIVSSGAVLGQSALIEKVLPQVIPGIYDYSIPVFDGALVRSLILSSPREALTQDEYNQSTMWGWEKIWAGYVLGHAALGPLGLEAGVRFERSDIDNHYWASGWAASSTRYDKVLPSLLLSWQAGAAGLYRASIGSSYARPAFFQLGGGVTTDIGTGGTLTITEGNPHLKATDATNFDLSGDWDVGTAGHVTVAGFWKALRHYMYNQGSVYLDTQSQTEAATTIVTPHNGGAAHIGGIEASLSERFSFLPQPFDGLGVELNGTVQHSVAHLDNPALSGDLPMQSAPGTLANASLYYDGAGVEAALSYHYTGDYLEQYGLWGGIYSNGALSKWVHEARSVDLSLGYHVTDGITVGAQVHNLLADTTYYSTIGRHNDAVPQIIEAGRVFYVTSSYTF